MTDKSKKQKPPELLNRMDLGRKIKQLELKVDRLSMLHRAGRALAASLDPNEVLTRIVEAAIAITRSEEGALLLVDRQTNELYVRAQKGLGEKTVQTLRLPAGDSVAGEVFATGQSIQLDHTKLVTGFIATHIIYVPVIYKNEKLGVLLVDNRKAERAFKEDDGQMLRIVADYAAIALKNTSLVENLENRNQILTNLHTTGHLILSALTLDKVLSQIVEAAIDVLAADIIVLYQYNKEDDDVTVPPTFQGKLQAPEILQDKGCIIQHEKSAVFKMVHRGKSFYAPNARVDWVAEGLAEVPSETDQESFIIRESIVSSAGIILMAINETVGVMFVNYQSAHMFPKEEKEVIEIFANQAAIAIQHARLFNQQQKQMEQEKTLREQSEKLRKSLEALSSTLKLDDTSERILDELHLLVEYKKASLQLIRGDIRTLCAGKGFEVRTANPWFNRMISKDRLISRVVARKSPLILSETNEDPDWDFNESTANVKSWAGVPLVYEQEVIGLLTLDHDEPGFYKSVIHSDVLDSFAHQAAIDVRRADLFDSAQERIQHLEIVNTFTQIMATKLDTQDLLNTMTAQIAKRLRCAQCTIFLLEEENGELVLAPQATTGEDSEQVLTRRFRPGEGLAGWVLQHGESLILNDAQKDPHFAPTRRKRKGPLPMLVVPVKAGDQTLGVISADQSAVAWFSESDKGLVEALALQTGIAIMRNTGLDFLQDIVNRIVSLQDRDPILREIVSGAIRLTNTSTGIIYLISDDGRSIVAHFCPPGFVHPAPRLNLQEGLTRQVMMTRKVLPILDVRNDPRVHPEVRKHFQSMIAVPLKTDEKVIGVLYLNDEQRHDFTDTEVSMLLTLASAAVIAIQNTNLFQEEKSRLEELADLYKKLETLSYEAIGLIGATTYAELSSKSLSIVSQVLDSNAALYRCDQNDPDVLVLEGCVPDDFRLQLNTTWRLDGTPIRPGEDLQDYPHRFMRAHSRENRFEGIVFILRTRKQEHFSQFDETILLLLATAIAHALQKLRFDMFASSQGTS